MEEEMKWLYTVWMNSVLVSNGNTKQFEAKQYAAPNAESALVSYFQELYRTSERHRLDQANVTISIRRGDRVEIADEKRLESVVEKKK